MVGELKVERRSVQGSGFDELRLTTSSPLPLEALCDAIWAKNLSNAKPEGAFKKRVLIRESETERVTYEQIGVPVVSDRDYVMQVSLVQPSSSGRCEVAFKTCQDPNFPPAPHFVRIAEIRGDWLLTPAEDGRTTISYVIFSDPGGGVPAFFARGGQRDAAISFMKTILARAGGPPPR
jgi:hypothetical protein